jgi:hypothetical protein
LGPLGARAAAANSFAKYVDVKQPDRLPIVSAPTAQLGTAPKYGQIESRSQPSLSAHQSALVGMSQLLESVTDVAAESLLGRTKRMVTGFDGVVDVAMERSEQFLTQQRQATS